MKSQISVSAFCISSVLSLSAAQLYAHELPELTVYTYSSFTSSWGPGPVLKDAFEAVCECRLKFVSSDDGVSLLNRLRLEGDRTRADVVMGLDDMLMPQAKQFALVQPHHITLQDIPLRPSLNWEDRHFIPFDFGFFTFVYDQTNILEPVTSMDQLLASDATVIYQDPRTSTPGQGLMHWMQVLYGNDAGDAWQRLTRNTVTVTKGWSEAYAMFLQGEADYVLSYSTSPAYHLLVEDNDQYAAATFTEGHLAQIEVAAISSFSREPELAKAFLVFLLEAETQALIAQHNWMLPVRTDIELPAPFDAAERTALQLSPETANLNRRDWLRVWRSAASQ